jgi:hypothetical protein
MTDFDAYDEFGDFDGTDAHPLMTALGQGLPITLLVDLIDPKGPRSFEMYAREQSGRRAITSDVDSAMTA